MSWQHLEIGAASSSLHPCRVTGRAESELAHWPAVRCCFHVCASMQRLARRSNRLLRQGQVACSDVCCSSSKVGVARFAVGAADQTPQDSIEVFVNGVPTQVAKGSTVMQACDAAGIDIPRSGAASDTLEQCSILIASLLRSLRIAPAYVLANSTCCLPVTGLLLFCFVSAPHKCLHSFRVRHLALIILSGSPKLLLVLVHQAQP